MSVGRSNARFPGFDFTNLLILNIVSFQDLDFIDIHFAGSESDRPKPKRGRKAGTKKEKSRRGTTETLKGKMPLSKETISTSESDSDTGGLKIASG